MSNSPHNPPPFNDPWFWSKLFISHLCTTPTFGYGHYSLAFHPYFSLAFYSDSLSPFWGSMKMEFYRRRRYNRLSSWESSDDEEDQNQNTTVLGGQTQSHVKYYMKNIVLPKLHQKIMTSITLVKKLRDAYVDVMHNLAENVVQLNNSNSYLLPKKPPRASSKVVTSSEK